MSEARANISAATRSPDTRSAVAGEAEVGLDKGPSAAFWASTALVTIGLLAMAHARETRALVNAFDTGLYMQVLHRMASAGDAMSSVTGEANFLAHHFQPIIFLLVPLFAAWPAALSLFSVAAVMVLSTLGLWRRLGIGYASAAMSLAFLCHPAVAGRLYYGFVPEVMALPALAWLSWRLAKAESMTAPSLWGIVAACAWAGLCKENIWLVNAWVTALMAFLAPVRLRVPLIGLVLVNASIFFYVFFSWMPAHSHHASYYGLGFFGGGGLGGMFATFASGRSLTTLLMQVFVLTTGLVVLAPWRFLVAAVPGLAMIVLATAPHLHHPGNHYPLLYLPFLWTGILVGMSRRPLEKARLWPWMALAVNAGITLAYGSNCLLDTIAKMQTLPHLSAIPGDVAKIRETLPKNAVVLTQDSLQPLFYDYPDVSHIMSYTGNPKRLDAKYLASVTDVITTLDISGIPDCHASAQSLTALPGFDAGNFVMFCQWLKDAPYASHLFEGSRLFHYRLAPISRDSP